MCPIGKYFVFLCFVKISAVPLPEIKMGVGNLNAHPFRYVDDNKLVSSESKERKPDDPRTLDTLAEIYKGGILAGLSLLSDVMSSAKRPISNEIKDKIQEYIRSRRQESILRSLSEESSLEITTESPPMTTSSDPSDMITPYSFNFDRFNATFFNNEKNKNTTNESSNNKRQVKDDNPLDNEIEDVDFSLESSTEGRSKSGNQTEMQSENQEEEDETSEEAGGVVGGLISTLLSGLSKPDGGVDLEALVGLIGGLSVQKDDGTFDFNGLTELLMGFLGGDGEGGGGSDVGSFLGGLLGATIKGLAKPPGAKGAGIFAGNVLNGILPGLSAPPPPKEEAGKPQQGLDSGGFLAGLISTILGGSSGSTAANTTSTGTNPFNQIKQGFFKSIFRIFSGIIGASSSSGHH